MKVKEAINALQQTSKSTKISGIKLKLAKISSKKLSEGSKPISRLRLKPKRHPQKSWRTDRRR